MLRSKLASLGKKAAVAPDVPWRCNALHMVVYTITGDDHLHYCYSEPGPGGHCPRGGGATGQGTTVLTPTHLFG